MPDNETVSRFVALRGTGRERELRLGTVVTPRHVALGDVEAATETARVYGQLNDILS